MTHTVFITGCASGFGAGAVRALLARGHTVIATDPDLDALEPLAALGAIVLRLDLRDPASIHHAVSHALPHGPTALVNNGGYAVFATQEEGDVDQMREMFDVNVFGAARLTKALLPRLRECGGTVVQLSSVAGRTVFPESGWYAATKHALEALSEALYQETCTFGVKVRLIEPGSFDTCFLSTAAALSPPKAADSPYASLFDLWMDRKVEVLEPPQDPTAVVEAIVAALDDPRPFYRQPVGPDSEQILALKDALGPDGFSLLSGQRNGGPGLCTPEAVISGDAEARRQAQLAWDHGHLDHWRDDERGRQALLVLGVSPDRG